MTSLFQKRPLFYPGTSEPEDCSEEELERYEVWREARNDEQIKESGVQDEQ